MLPFFGTCIIHILHIQDVLILKKNSGAKGLTVLMTECDKTTGQTDNLKSQFTQIVKQVTVIIFTRIFICKSRQNCGYTSPCFYQLLCHWCMYSICFFRSLTYEQKIKKGAESSSVANLAEEK
jgi:hypothetical protein